MASSLGRAIGAFVDRALAPKSLRKTAQMSATTAKAAETVKDLKNPAEAAKETPRDRMRKIQAVFDAGDIKNSPEKLIDEAIRLSIDSTPATPGSLLFVPCSNLKALEKVRTLPADAFILDLEDAVPLAKKETARDNLRSLAKAGAFDGKTVFVRVNSVRDNPQHGFNDLDTCGVLSQKISGVCIPKVEVGDFEVISPATHPDLTYWAFIETAKGVVQADELAASGNYSAFVFGGNDLGSDLLLPGPEFYEAVAREGTVFLPPRVGLQASMARIILAARARGLPVFDGVFNDFSDQAAFRRDCVFGKALGFDGKTLIHPNQIRGCNEVYDPSPKELEWARRVIQAVTMTEGGVSVVDGRIVEELHMHQAGVILRRAEYASTRGKAVETSMKSESELEAEADRILQREKMDNMGAYDTKPEDYDSTAGHMPTFADVEGCPELNPTSPKAHGIHTAEDELRVSKSASKVVLEDDMPDESEYMTNEELARAHRGEAAESDSSSSRMSAEDAAAKTAEAYTEGARRRERRHNRVAPTRMSQRDYKKMPDEEAYDPISEVQVVRWRR